MSIQQSALRRGQGSPNRWEPDRFDRFPVLPVRPGSKTDQEPVPTAPKKLVKTVESGLMGGLPGFPLDFFGVGKLDRVRFCEPWPQVSDYYCSVAFGSTKVGEARTPRSTQ
jgi:hypothetical protein